MMGRKRELKEKRKRTGKTRELRHMDKKIYIYRYLFAFMEEKLYFLVVVFLNLNPTGEDGQRISVEQSYIYLTPHALFQLPPPPHPSHHPYPQKELSGMACCIRPLTWKELEKHRPATPSNANYSLTGQGEGRRENRDK
jgi:hypothetical protein